MRPAIDVRDRSGSARRGRALLHGRSARPRRRPPTRSTTTSASPSDRRRRRARAVHQGHGGPAAPGGRETPHRRAARALRPAGAPAHPRHRRRPARHLPRRARGRGRRRRRRVGADGGHDEPAVAVRDRRGGRALVDRDRAVPRGALRARALLGGRPAPLRALRERACRRRPAASTTTRSPAASSPTCASRPRRSGSATGSKTSRPYAAADRILGRIVKVTPTSKVVGDLALAARRVECRPGGVRRRTGALRHARLGDRLPCGRARCSSERMARAVPDPGARGTRAGTRGGDGLPRGRGRRSMAPIDG